MPCSKSSVSVRFVHKPLDRASAHFQRTQERGPNFGLLYQVQIATPKRTSGHRKKSSVDLARTLSSGSNMSNKSTYLSLRQLVSHLLYNLLQSIVELLGNVWRWLVGGVAFYGRRITRRK